MNECFPNEDFADAECLSEAILNACDSLGCGSMSATVNLDQEFNVNNCSIIDCSTFHCTDVNIIINSQVTTLPVTFSGLTLDEVGTPVGTLSFNNTTEPFDCLPLILSP